MEQIRKRVGKLDSLRVVGLDGEDVNGAGSKDEEDMITTTCPGERSCIWKRHSESSISDSSEK